MCRHDVVYMQSVIIWQITWRASLSATGPFPSPTLSFGSKLEYTSAKEDYNHIAVDNLLKMYNNNNYCIAPLGKFI